MHACAMLDYMAVTWGDHAERTSNSSCMRYVWRPYSPPTAAAKVARASRARWLRATCSAARSDLDS